MAHLLKIGDKWYGDFTHQGKRIRRALSPFKEEAKLLLPDLVRSVRGLRPGESADMSWGLFRTKYLEFSKANKVADTLYKDTHAFDLVDRHSEIKRLNEMTPELLETLKMKWTEEGETQSIVTRSVKAIKTAMRRAEDLKYVPLQNWRIVKVEEPAGRQNFYTVKQFKTLLKKCDPEWQLCAMLQGRAGLRFGEAFNLEWPDIEWDNKRIRIHSRPGGWRIKGDRKGTAQKFVPLEPDLYDYLWARRKKQGFLIDPEGYRKANGERMTSNWFLNKFRTFFRRAKLVGKPHDLRHTAASWMINAGSTEPEVGAVLGHKPGSKATAIYTHITEQTKHAAIQRMPRL